MSEHSNIEWCDASWNPVTGCTPISHGCDHCYARTMTKRLCAAGVKKYADGFKVRMHEESLLEPMKWKKPKRVFVCSMGDLFHEDVTSGFIEKVLETAWKHAPQHTYLFLTKRPERMAVEFTGRLPPNVWCGVTVEDAFAMTRIEHLRKVGARVRFVSFEPLIGPLPELSLDGIDWAICGGETGRGARTMEAAWVRAIKAESDRVRAKWFFKRWGDAVIDGDLRVMGREFPE